MGTRTSSDYVKTKAQQSGVAFVQLWVVDILGRLRGVTITTAQLDAALDDGVVVSAEILGLTGAARRSELLLSPDPSTWALLPRHDGDSAARMLCDVLRPDGAPCPWDARGALKRALGRATALGYTFYVGAAIQHHYLTTCDGGPPRPLGEGPGYGFGPSPQVQALAQTTVRQLEQLSAAVNAFAQASGPSQLTFELAYADALTLADAVTTHRRVVSQVARAAGKGATFMPFPFAAAAANRLDLTLSLLDDGEPAFYDPRDPDGRSPVAHQFADGLEVAAPELSLLARPTVNSYTRPLPEGARVGRAPVAACRGDEAPLSFVGADASANPYLLLAAVLEAGLGGVRGDAPAAPAAGHPVTLVQAARMAESSSVLHDALGAPLLRAVVEAARADGVAYRTQVTPWELRRYLDVY